MTRTHRPKNATKQLAILLLFTFLAPALQGGERAEVMLWPAAMPGPKSALKIAERVERGPDGIARRSNVSQPRLFVYEPPAALRTGAAAIVIPGGGFARLADEHEGSDACEWLNRLGITAFMLAYRCPPPPNTSPNVGPAQDAQRAMQMVRIRAAQWKLDPAKIGMLGFSAGGQIALVATTNELLFPADAKVAARHEADFLMLVYPYQIYSKATKALRSDIKISDRLPPMFITQSSDDTSSLPQGSTLLALDLFQRKIPCELHLYEKGGHGFGMRPRPNAVGPTDWPLRAADWLRARKLANGK
jgi:acetyl esterase/lipase